MNYAETKKVCLVPYDQVSESILPNLERVLCQQQKELVLFYGPNEKQTIYCLGIIFGSLVELQRYLNSKSNIEVEVYRR